ncbi:fungal-specific transcription factor-like protein [Thozetella sp. PMI_491]|nr:fungal-specific transcription factor-like protein [Thozetella sp. PMI_491]
MPLLVLETGDLAFSIVVSKSMCDLKYPNCSNCESAQVPCLTYHPGKQADLPRDYVSNLEDRVAKLSQEIEELRAQIRDTPINGTSLSISSGNPMRNGLVPFDPASPTTSESGPSHLQDLVKSVQDVVVEPSRQPRFLGQGGGITLAKLVLAAIRVDALPASPLLPTRHSYEGSPMLAAEASLPPRHAADHLVDVYFQYRTPHMPIIERFRVEEAVENVYRVVQSGCDFTDLASERDFFTTYMVFAIALCDVPNPTGGRPVQSEGCFRSAIGWIEKVITYSKSDIETLRAILLLAQFVALFPSQGSLWHLTGTALRLSIDIGLHWETDDQCLQLDPGVLHDRRRLWYSTYQFDRFLCITLGRPLGIIDESTRVQLPSPWTMTRSFAGSGSEPNEIAVHSQRAHNHLFNMSKLESEIVHVQHSQSWARTIAYPRANYSTWIQDIQPRLQEWYSTIPPPSKAHQCSIFACQAYWDVVYNSAVLLLYRPNSMVPHVSPEHLAITFDASCKLIASIKVLQREGKVDILWKSVHHLFMAGLGVIYCLWHSKEIRDRQSVGSSISTLQSCASTLSAMSETFPGASGCRDTFDTLSAATVDWLVRYDNEKTNQDRLEFEAQVKELLQQLQPSRNSVATAYDGGVTNMSSLLSTDNFAFSEMLSSAAQWPSFQSMGDFSGVL